MSMERFFARLEKTGFGGSAATLPDDLILTPQVWSASDRGGCQLATIGAGGTAASLLYLSGWLGDRVEIFNAAGDCCWWGVIWELEIIIGNVVLSLTLDSIYNRVAVIYPAQNADGTVESATTDWAEDTDSMDRYGARELLYGMPESWSESADTVRDQLLERFKTASPVVNSQPSAQYSAQITAMGVWQKAATVYFTNPDGLVEHTGESGSFYIGRYLVSDEIFFGVTTDIGSEVDEMHIITGDFDPLAPDDTFTVSGSTSNDGTYTIQEMDSNQQITISGSWVSEEDGATVKISYGEGISYDNIAMSFETTTTWVVTHVAVKVRQVGSPSDNFRIGIYPDSAGVPGTVLTANETAGSALFTELTWTEFAFETPVTLTSGVTYYLGLRRTGAATLDSGYEVALDEDLGYVDGTAQFYNGTAWVTRTPDCDMPFRIIGEISSTAQLEKAIAVVDAFSQSLIQVDSLIPVRQYSVDERTAMETMNEMLDSGTSTNDRLVAWVTRDDTVIVSTEDTMGFGESLLVLGSDGRLRYGVGGFYPPGRLVYGQHIEMESLALAAGFGPTAVRGTGVYCQSSEYDALSDILTIQSEGAIDPFTALKTRKG